MNIPDVIKRTLKEYRDPRLDRDDLLQEAWIAYIEARRVCKYFDKFEAYVSIRMRGRINEFIRNCRLIRVPYDGPRKSGTQQQAELALNLKRHSNTTFYDRDYISDDSLVVKMLSLLTDRESEVLVLRLGMDGASPRQSSEVAYILNISHTHVVRCERQALEKLRNAFPEYCQNQNL